MWPFGRSRERIRREASEWTVRLAKDPDVEQRAAFARWRAADPLHAEAFDRIQRIWSASEALSPAAIRRTEPRHAFPPLAIAASLVAALAVVAMVVTGAWQPVAGDGHLSRTTFAAADEQKSLRLEDGSRLVLGRQSRVTKAFGSAERRLILEQGWARFVVARGDRPFVVDAGAAVVTATGTQFDIAKSDGGAVVTLHEGRVEVRGPLVAEARRLKPGEMLEVRPGSEPVLRPAGASRIFETRMVGYQGEVLSRVIAAANRDARPRIVLAEPSIGQMRVTGAFRAGDNRALARSLGAALGLELRTEKGDTLVLAQPAG